MLLNQDQEMIRDALRDFVREQITPHAARWDKEHEFPKGVHQGLAALGAYGICVPEELGGAGLDYVSLALVLEEIAAGDGGTSTVISVTNCPVNAILMKYGNAGQQEQWLRPLAQGQMLGAFCLTEPHVGSDASALRTTAVRDGGDYVINGVKQFITSGKNGDVAIVIAVTDKAAGKKGMSAFIVPTGNLGKAVDVVIDYCTKETKSCYLSKDPVTNELFHMPVEQARIPRKVKDYTLSPKEYDAAVRGEEVPIRFKSDNGKFYATSIQMSAAERGVEFLWERSTKKLEEAQKQGQEQDGSQQQPHAPVQVAGKPRKKEEASQQAEKKPRTRKPSITPKM